MFVVITAIILFWRTSHRTAFFFLVVSAGGMLYKPLKAMVARPRPDSAGAVIQESGWGFPSGHAMASVIVFVSLAWAVWQLSENQRIREAFITIAALLVVAIPLSRIVLGVHWLSDVVGGLAFGTAWTAGVFAIRNRTRRRGSRS